MTTTAHASDSPTDRTPFPSRAQARVRGRLFLVTLIAAAACVAEPSAAAGGTDGRTGQQVVESVCAGCHAAGANGAPKIGDAEAWKPLAARGLESLSQSAIRGIRNNRAHGGSPGQWRPSAARAQWRAGDMPARGGNPGLSDLEIERAVTYMVNMSGGHWIEPAAGMSAGAERKERSWARTEAGSTLAR